MTIRRGPRPPRSYTRLENVTIEDARLSFKALGLLTYLLSKPDHWTFNREHLAGSHIDGTDSVRSGLRELRDSGYIRDEVERDQAGKISGRIAVVYDRPPADHEESSPHGGKPASRDKPQEGARPLVSTDGSEGLSKARTENPPTPHAGQLALVEPTPPAAPREQHLAVGQNLGTDRDLAFVAFWERYPRKTGKGQARDAWRKARRRGVAPEVIVRGVERYRDDPNREDGYTKHPATWLNGECWDDDPLPSKLPAARSGGGGRMGATLGLLRQRADQRSQAALPTGTGS